MILDELTTKQESKIEQSNVPTRRKEAYFKDVKEAPYSFVNPQQQIGQGLTPRFGGGSEQVIQIGTGDDSFNVDLSGMWMGHRRFVSAPFRVNMKGQGVFSLMSLEGQEIVGPGGIQSIPNFPLSFHKMNYDLEIEGTDWQLLPALTHIINDVVQPVIALFFTQISGYHEDAGERLEFRFMHKSSEVGNRFVISNESGGTDIKTVSAMVSHIIDAGDNDLTIEARSSSVGSGHIKGAVIESSSTAILLGR